MADEAKTMAVVGLGSMGEGIANSLLRAGHTVYGVDLNDEAVKRFGAAGGAPGIALDAAGDIEILVLVVLNDRQTEAVLFDANGWVPKLSRATTIVACATVPPEFAAAMAERCHEHGLHYLDAPISGGTAKAAEGRLSIMAAGTREAFDGARPMLDACAETVFELGEESGQGSAMKAVNQMLAGVHIAAMAEAITFGITQGVSPEKVLEVIPKCAGTSWMFENRAPHIVEGDYTPRSMVDIWPKDLGIVLDVARQAKFGAPVTAAALQQFLAASGSGLGSEDDAAVAKVYARNADIKLPGGRS